MNEVHFYSLAPRLKNEAGHDFIYHQCVKKSVEQAGCVCTVFIDKTAQILSLPQGFQPHFENEFFSKKYQNLLKKNTTQDSTKLYFLDSFCLQELFDLVLAFQRFGRASDQLWLLLRYDFQQLRWQGKLHVQLIKLLIRKLGARLTLLTDSSLIQKELEPLFSFPISVLPIPHTDTLISQIKSQACLTCWWPGPPRESKGQKEISGILQLSPPKNVAIEVFASSDAGFTSPMNLFYALPPILSREAYCSQLITSDILLLPYHAPTYRCSTSGIFVEGVVAGKMPLVKEGTWLAHELHRFQLSELIVDWESPLFWHHLHNLHHSPSIRKNLSLMQKEYQELHSLSNYSKHCLQLLCKN